MLDCLATHNQAKSTQQRTAVVNKRRKAQSLHQVQISIAQNRIWQMESRGHLTLIVSRLRAEPIHAGSQTLKLRVVVSESTVLGSAPAGSRNLIPTKWRVLVRNPGARVGINHRPSCRGPIEPNSASRG